MSRLREEEAERVGGRSFSRNLSLAVFVDETNSNIALRVFRRFFLPQFVKDAWLFAWVIHAEHIRAMWLAVV